MKATIKIAIADDHALFKDGILGLLAPEPDMEVTTVAANGIQFIEQLHKDKLPDIALIDLDMPAMNGLELTTYLKENYPSIKIIILSAYGQDRFVVKLIEAGASAFIPKDSDVAILFDAIRQTHRNGFYMTEKIFKIMQGADVIKKNFTSVNKLPVELTKREIEILRLICSEKTNQEIADSLFVSVRTIEGHRNNLLLKTGCKNTAGLVMFAVRHQLVLPSF